MAINMKGMRPITVDGIKYRWKESWGANVPIVNLTTNKVYFANYDDLIYDDETFVMPRHIARWIKLQLHQ